MKRRCLRMCQLTSCFLMLGTSIGVGLSQDRKLIDLRTIPYPGDGDWGTSEQREKLLDCLVSIAESEQIDWHLRAEVAAAARRIDPIDLSAFVAEHTLFVSSFRKDSELSLEDAGVELSDAMSAIAWPDSAIPFAVHLTGLGVELGPSFTFGKFSDQVAAQAAAVDSNAPEANASASIAFLSTSGPIEVDLQLFQQEDGPHFDFKLGDLEQSYSVSAFREAIHYLALEQPEQLRGKHLAADIAYREDHHAARDGPAPTLALTVGLVSMLQSTLPSAEVAYVADVNADGSVQPIYDLGDRIFDNRESHLAITVVPRGDRSSLEDLLLLRGPLIFLDTQVIEITEVNEALELAFPERRLEATTEAVRQFAEIARVLKGPEGRQHFKNPHLPNRLRGVLEKEPRHLSARLILRYLDRDLPRYLSMRSSIDMVFEPLDISGEEEVDVRIDQSVGVASLRGNVNRIDPLMRPMAAAVLKLDDASSRVGDGVSEQERLGKAIYSEILNLRSNPLVQERVE
ncbi:MAG: S16 family serine protease [Verrucomicrobiota bacterium]